MSPFSVKDIRKDFPNLRCQVHNKPLVYFDNAATTFKPQCVIDSLVHHYTSETSNVHRGVHTLSEKATMAYESVRVKTQQFIKARDDKEIIFTKGTTDAINCVAQSLGQSLGPCDEILISCMEHHSNIVPWQMICEQRGCSLKVIPINDKGELIYDEFKKLLTERTKLVSIVYISNSLGSINPIKSMIAEAHRLDVPVLVDAAQAVSQLRIDVQDLDCDFLAFSSHKLFGPTGVGVLYGKTRFLETMPPYQGGGDMIKTVSFEGTVYNTIPYKFEAGTPNIAGVIGFGVALSYVEGFDWDAMQRYKKDVFMYATDKLKGIEGLRIIGEADNKAGIISFIIDNIHAHDIGVLLDQQGVAVRTGHHCTMPVMKHFNISSTTRVSLSCYNTKEEVDKLFKALQQSKDILS